MLSPQSHLDRPLDVTMEAMDRQDYKSESSSVASSASTAGGAVRPSPELTIIGSNYVPSAAAAAVAAVAVPNMTYAVSSAAPASGASSSGPEDLSPISIDPRYLERRRRNNEAVRRCRENKRVRTQMRAEMSTILEVENRKLRLELDGLNSEVRELKSLLIERQRLNCLEKVVEGPPPAKVAKPEPHKTASAALAVVENGEVTNGSVPPLLANCEEPVNMEQKVAEEPTL